MLADPRIKVSFHVIELIPPGLFHVPELETHRNCPHTIIGLLGEAKSHYFNIANIDTKCHDSIVREITSRTHKMKKRIRACPLFLLFELLWLNDKVAYLETS